MAAIPDARARLMKLAIQNRLGILLIDNAGGCPIRPTHNHLFEKPRPPLCLEDGGPPAWCEKAPCTCSAELGDLPPGYSKISRLEKRWTTLKADWESLYGTMD